MNETSPGIAPPAFRLPPSTRLGRVRLQVSSLDRSRAFYEQVFGLGTIRRTGDGLTLAAHGDDRPLVELSVRPRERHRSRAEGCSVCTTSQSCFLTQRHSAGSRVISSRSASSRGWRTTS